MIVFINHSMFKASDSSAYIEIYFKIPLNTLTLQQNENNTFYGSVNYSIKITQDQKTFYEKSFELASPEISDTNNLNLAISELKRIGLKKGKYRLDIVIYDINDEKSKAQYNSIIDADYNQDMIGFSGVSFIDTFLSTKTENKFSRVGYDMYPNVINTYSELNQNLFAYLEIYNTDRLIADDIFFIKYFIEKEGKKVEGFEGVLQRIPVPVVPLIIAVNIGELGYGKFSLVFEVYSKKNELLNFQKAYFSKIHTEELKFEHIEYDEKELLEKTIESYNKDQLMSYMDYISFIGSEDERDEIEDIKSVAEISEMKTYLYNFWLNRDTKDPASAWLDYLERIEECNSLFTSGMRKGYLTDRGRVFLLYGRPNDIVESIDPTIAYPYQIWHYYSTPDHQVNRKFVFFNRSGTLAEFELIHSDAIGEIQNPTWKDVIRKANRYGTSDDGIFGDYLDDDFGQ
jgi:GWxTD domain-containing protein